MVTGHWGPATSGGPHLWKTLCMVVNEKRQEMYCVPLVLCFELHKHVFVSLHSLSYIFFSKYTILSAVFFIYLFILFLLFSCCIILSYMFYLDMPVIIFYSAVLLIFILHCFLSCSSFSRRHIGLHTQHLLLDCGWINFCRHYSIDDSRCMHFLHLFWDQRQFLQKSEL